MQCFYLRLGPKTSFNSMMVNANKYSIFMIYVSNNVILTRALISVYDNIQYSAFYEITSPASIYLDSQLNCVED